MNLLLLTFLSGVKKHYYYQKEESLTIFLALASKIVKHLLQVFSLAFKVMHDGFRAKAECITFVHLMR